MYCKTDIVDELERDMDLGMRFKAPLREINIQANMGLEGNSLPTLDYINAEEQQYSWDAGWQLSDRIIEDAQDI